MATRPGYEQIEYFGQRFGFDRFEINYERNTCIVAKYGQCLEINIGELYIGGTYSSTNPRKLFEDAIKSLKNQALEKLSRSPELIGPHGNIYEFGPVNVAMSPEDSPDYASCMTTSGPINFTPGGYIDVTCFGDRSRQYIRDTWQEPKIDIKKQKKAENKAVKLLQNMIGPEQCDIYRKTHRIIVKPEKVFWVIGDCLNSFNDKQPFNNKPDVFRVDNAKKNHVTYFCVDQAGGGKTPYTDKVISFVSNPTSAILGNAD